VCASAHDPHGTHPHILNAAALVLFRLQAFAPFFVREPSGRGAVVIHGRFLPRLGSCRHVGCGRCSPCRTSTSKTSSRRAARRRRVCPRSAATRPHLQCLLLLARPPLRFSPTLPPPPPHLFLPLLCLSPCTTLLYSISEFGQSRRVWSCSPLHCPHVESIQAGTASAVAGGGGGGRKRSLIIARGPCGEAGCRGRC